MNTTIFRPVKDFPGYAVGETGELISFHCRKEPFFLKPCFDSHTGYYKNRIKHRSGVMKTVTVHSLVARAFLGERPEGYDIDHKDGNKLNNCVTNLHYVSRKQNQLNPNNHGKNGWQKLASRKVIAIKDGVEQVFDSCSEMCDVLGLLPSCVSSCLSGKRYAQTHKGYTFRWANED